ncbi:unnamed protein product [Ectocarpus sp. 8 AP-2014]
MACAQRDMKNSMVAKRRSDRQAASGSATISKSAATALGPASDSSRQGESRQE